MSVQHGRVQRQLLAPTKAIYRFRYTEGQAMSPSPVRHSIASAIGALFLVAIAGGLSTYGVLINDQHTMWVGVILMSTVFIWMLYHI